jgi:hypothetical protein
MARVRRTLEGPVRRGRSGVKERFKHEDFQFGYEIALGGA